MTNNNLVLVIDAGSSWCKAAYVNREGGIVSAGEAWVRDRRPFGHDVDSLDRIWRGVVEAVQEANTHLDRPAPTVLAVAARKAPGIWLDAADRPVGLPQDVVNSTGRETIERCYASPLWKDDDPFAYGYGIDLIGNTRWLKERRPDAFLRVCRAGNLHSWLLLKLTGQWLTSPAGGPVQQEWPGIVHKLCGLSPNSFPGVVPDSDIISPIMPDAAADLGLAASTRVITGTHDGAAANIGAGTILPGEACLTFGTNGVMRVVTGDRIPGRFGYTVTGDQWALVRDLPDLALLLDDVVAAITDSPGPITPAMHERLAADAASVPPGCGGFRLALFPDSGGSTVRDAMHQDLTSAIIYRAALEAIGLGFAGLAEQARAAGITPARYAATGGAAANDLLLRITSACLDAPIRVTIGEPGLAGLACLAAVGAGWVPTMLDAVTAMIRTGHLVVAVSDSERIFYANLVATSPLPAGLAPGDSVA